MSLARPPRDPKSSIRSLLTCVGLFWEAGFGESQPYKSDYTASNMQPVTTNIRPILQSPAVTGQITANKEIITVGLDRKEQTA